MGLADAAYHNIPAWDWTALPGALARAAARGHGPAAPLRRSEQDFHDREDFHTPGSSEPFAIMKTHYPGTPSPVERNVPTPPPSDLPAA
jgi:hypothetical protein